MSNPTAISDIEREEHNKTYGAKKVVPYYPDGAGNLVVGEPNYALIMDDTTTSNVTYIGKAAIGSSAASAVWQIKKMDESSNLTITWADGDDSFDNVWNNRASLSYS